MRPLFLFLIAILLVFPTRLSAIFDNRMFHPIYLSEFTSINECSEMIEDKSGFIWVAYSEGVARYDGHLLRTYPMDYEFCRKIVMLPNGRILLFNLNNRFSVSYFDPIQDKFIQVTTDAEATVVDSRVNFYSIDDNNNVYFATANGIIRYTHNNNKLVVLNRFMDKMNVKSITVIDHNQIVFTTTKKIFQASINRNKLDIIHSQSFPESMSILSTIYDMHTQSVYIGTVKNGVWAYDITTHEVEKLDKVMLNNTPIRSLCNYDSEYFMVGTDGAGVLVIDKNTQSVVEHYTYSNTTSPKIGSNAIYDILIDKDKRIYCATYAHGVLVLDPTALSYEVIQPRTNDGLTVISTSVNAMHEDENGNLWIATNAGVYSQNKESKQWNEYKVPKGSSVSSNVMLSIASAGDEVYAGGYGTGLLRVNKYRKTLEPVITQSEQFPTFLFSIYYDKRNNALWTGGTVDKFYKYDIAQNKFSLPDEVKNISSIIKYNKNQLMFCSDYTPYLLNTETGEVTPFKFDNTSKTQMNKVNMILRQGEIIYFATNNRGLVTYNIRTKERKTYTDILGSDCNNIVSFTIDKYNKLWIANSQGIVVFDIENSKVKKYKLSYFVNVSRCVKKSAAATQDGRVWFGTQQGLLSINSENVMRNEKIVAPIITDFKIYYNSILEDRAQKVIRKPLIECDTLVLSHKQNTFSFHFSQINHSLIDRPRFSWYLEGVDTEWHPITTKSAAQYTGITHGEYCFNLRVFSENNDTEYIQKKIIIRILSPWWLHRMAIISYIIILTTLLLYIIRHYKRNLQHKFAKEKLEFFINASHDIRTPITLIKAPLSNISNDTQLSTSSQYMLSIVKKNVDKLQGMINKLLDFDNYNINNVIQEQEISINDYLKTLVDSYWEHALATNINIKLQLNQQNKNITLSLEHLDKILDNVLSNAIKYSHPKSEVLIESDYNAKYWEVKISDTGIGIPRKQQNQIFKQHFRGENAINSKQIGSGVGLMYTHRLIHEIGGSISFVSKENEGTVFTIKFPLTVVDEKNADELHLADILSENPYMESEILSNVPTEKPQILIVDDNDELREYISVCFSNEYKVITAPSPKIALEIIMQHNINLIISDIMMPEIDGFEFCKMLKSKAHLSHIPIILLSALTKSEFILKGLQYGVDDYVTKPFEPEQLKAKVKRIMDSRQQLAEYYANTQQAVSHETNEQVEDCYNELDKLFLEKMRETITKNLSNPEFNINSLCTELCMSRSVFYNRVKNLTNSTPVEMLRKERMEYAANLLRTKMYTVQEISDMVGFADSKYFSKVFYKYNGCLPSKY